VTPDGPTGPDPGLTPDEIDRRARSFGEVAGHYERYRPGPPVDAVAWMLPDRPGVVVDLGAGTGALSRILLDRADTVIAVEPDARMRQVFAAGVPGAVVRDGRGEAIPLPDGSADAVLASTSWHWMDPVPTLLEVGRVLVPGGTLGAVWSGPDLESPFVAGAVRLLSQQSDGAGPDLASTFTVEPARAAHVLHVPAGTPFDQPEQRTFTWNVALNADELIGLLGTFSWIIVMPEDRRDRVLAEARRLLRETLGVEGPVTVDVGYRAEAWRARRHG
jgi:SAM-dependent methyltransferase